MSAPIKIAIVAGEESGDALGADLLLALRKSQDGDVAAIGLGGARLQAAGLETLFDPHDIALMGFSAIVKKLPSLMRRIRQTADFIIAAKPDCLVIIDSPDFTHRVARRVKAADPNIPVVNYVCPSVWAWRPGRAAAMAAYIDEVLAILPFEPTTLKALGGPPATYAGHPLAQDRFFLDAATAQSGMELDRFSDWSRPLQLLCLPGSRRSEIDRHMPDFRDAIGLMLDRGRNLEVTIPSIERLRDRVEGAAKSWRVPVKVIVESGEKLAAFSRADAALAGSGTVTLELALSGIPLISIYRTDFLVRMLRRMITTWTTSLPNLIADQPLVPEYLDEMIRPGMLARQLELLARPGPSREAQLQGFDLVRERLQTDNPAGETAARRVLSHIKKLSHSK